MAYWYTYPADVSYDSDEDEEITEEEVEKANRQFQQHIDFEWQYFKRLGHVHFLYKFSQHIPPDVDYWKYVPLLDHPLEHLRHHVNQKTLDVIHEGITSSIDDIDKRVVATGTSCWTKRELKTVFSFADEWVSKNGMGKNNLLNDICGIAAKIIAFQNSHDLGHQMVWL